MAYYAKEKPRALIMSWGQFDPNNPDLSKLNNTRLEEAISKVSSAVGVAYSTIKPNRPGRKIKIIPVLNILWESI